MKQIFIESGTPLDQSKLNKIYSIFEESQCPNESLRATFADFVSFDGSVVRFAGGNAYGTVITL